MPQAVQSINIDLPVELAQRLDRFLSATPQRTKSDVVREALKLWLEAYEDVPHGGE